MNHVELQDLIKGENFLRCGHQAIPISEPVMDLYFSDPSKTFDLERLTKSLKNKSRQRLLSIPQFRFSADISWKILNQIIEAEIRSNSCDIVTIPDPTLRCCDYNWKSSIERALHKVNENLETGQYSDSMPILSLNQGKKILAEKIDYLLQKDIHAIGFRFSGSGRKYLNELLEPIKNREEKIWIHLCDVKKDWKDISNTHLSTLYGVDTVSIRKNYPPSKTYLDQQKEKVKLQGNMPIVRGVQIGPAPTVTIPKILKDSNIFEKSFLGYLNTVSYRKEIGERLMCNCPVCRSKKSIHSLSQLLTAEGKPILEVHNSVNSYEEFEKIKKSVDEDNVQMYFNDKIFIKEKIKDVIDRFPKLGEEA